MSKAVDQKFLDAFYEAEKLCNNNQLQESLAKYKSLLKKQPDHISVLNNVGLVYEKLGDFNKSLYYYSKCNDLQPNQPVLMHNLANTYTRLDRWADALPLLKRVIDLDFQPEDNTEKYALGSFNTQSKEQARELISLAITKYPENKLLNRLLGRSLLHLNAHVEGLKYQQKGAGFIEFDSKGVRYIN